MRQGDMWSGAFWKDLTERSLSTFAQTLVGALLVLGFGSTAGLLDVDWPKVLSVAAASGLLAILKGIGANLKDPTTGASLNSDAPEIEAAEAPTATAPQRGGTGLDDSTPTP